MFILNELLSMKIHLKFFGKFQIVSAYQSDENCL